MDNTDQLTELQLVLESADDIDFNYNKGSLLQGVLYEHIDSEYVDILHEQGVKPYSQCVRIEDGQIIWYIRTLCIHAMRLTTANQREIHRVYLVSV